jgi:hypothetical protein
MTGCEFLEECPMFVQFSTEGVKSFWIEMYCKGSQHKNCARKKLRARGEQIPDTLLPNGKHLHSLSGVSLPQHQV